MALDDPDGILEGTEPVSEPEEVPDRVDTPHRVGDAFEIPETTMPKAGGLRPAFDALGGDPMEIARALPLVPKHRLEPSETPPPPDEAQLEAEARELHLLALQRHGKTENVRVMVDRCRVAIEGYAERSVAQRKKIKPPQKTLDETRYWERALEECLERDRIMAERQAIWPGCWCLGTGGREKRAIVIWTKDKPPQPRRPRMPDGTEAMAWMEPCVCAAGIEQAEQARAMRQQMQDLVAQAHQDRILGAARIPEKYAEHTLATFPDQDKAGKVQGWYLRCLGEIPVPPGTNLRYGLYIHGPNRRGKTTLSIGVLKLALERGIPGIFRTVRELLRDLRKALHDDANTNFDEVLEAFRNAPLLILDDIGAERLTRGDTWIAEILIGLLEHRETEKLITVINSNLGWSETEEARKRRSLEHGSLEDRTWRASDYNPDELLDYVGERLWWRLDSMTNKLPLFSTPVLGYGTVTAPVLPDPSDEL